jgi:hypothetical protein
MVTLTVTDSNGSEATATLPVYNGSAPLQGMQLYSCTDTTYEAFDGNVWRSHTSTHGAPTVVGAGPYWATAEGWFAYSDDNLLTPPGETQVTEQPITSIWVHESQAGYVVVGTENGEIYVTSDHGANWLQRDGPDGPIQFIISSIFDKEEWHIVTPTGWYKSQDGGETWEIVRAGSFVYLELAHTRNIVVTSTGVLQRAETGTPFVGNTSPIVAATAHIREDRFYALAEDGTTWIQETSGSYTLVAGEPIPAGTPYHAGTYRDGQQIDLVYFAAQEGGLFKTLDGFRTPEGYYRLRTDGELTP